MTQMQHYIPVSILREFRAPEAWKLVPREQQRAAASRDGRVLRGGKPRNWPVCLFTKGRGYSREFIGEVFAERGFYSLVDPVDRFDRAMMRLALQVLHQGRFRTFRDLNHFLDLADQTMDPNVVEGKHLLRLDNDFAQLAAKIRAGSSISSVEFAYLLKLVTLQRFRSPGWKYFHVPEAIGRVKAHIERSTLEFESANGSSPTLGMPASEFYAAFYRHLYQLTVMKFTTDPMDYLWTSDVKATLLVATGRVPFICSDNPMRPYRIAKLNRILYDTPSGIETPGIGALLPLGPEHCLRFEVDRRAPPIPIPRLTLMDDEVRTVNTILLYSSYRAFVCNSPRDDLFVSSVAPGNVPRPRVP